ncbi:Midasin [Plasmodiophora brassicae]
MKEAVLGILPTSPPRAASVEYVDAVEKLLETGLVSHSRATQLVSRTSLLALGAHRALLLSLGQLPPATAAIACPADAWSRSASVCSSRQMIGRIPIRLQVPGSAPGDGTFVALPHFASAMESLAMALATGRPVLLQGPPSSGKSTLLRAFSRRVGRPVDPIRLVLDDDTDVKSLLGTYVCTETPGEFRYVPGVLTRAVVDGQWIVIDGIDRCPPDIISIIRELLERGRIGDQVAHDEFRLFATRSVPLTAPYDALFSHIVIPALTPGDVLSIISDRFPSLVPHRDTLLRTLTLTNSAPIRAFVRLCQRLHHLSLPSAPSSAIREKVLEHVHVCLVAWMPAGPARDQLSNDIAALWRIDAARNAHVVRERDPHPLASATRLAPTRAASVLMSRIHDAVDANEPVLLVGETGNGKTAMLDECARQRGRVLVVCNMSQQSDTSELLGGYRPVDLRTASIPILNAFGSLFPLTFSRASNATFLASIRQAFDNGHWANLAKLLSRSTSMALDKPVSPERRRQWQAFARDLDVFRRQVQNDERGAFAFWFVEGALVRALRQGDWILLDEINLAASSTLFALQSLLDPSSSSAFHFEGRQVERHPSFRLFAAMNPNTDAGKRPLPHPVRSRFTEIFVDDVDDAADLRVLVQHVLPAPVANHVDVVDAYRTLRRLSGERALTSSGMDVPVYSLRTLCRALRYARDACNSMGVARALHEGMTMAFLTPCDAPSRSLCAPHLSAFARSSGGGPSFRRPPPDDCIEIAGFRLRRGPLPPVAGGDDDEFILTATVEERLTDVCRALGSGVPLPVLLQGPTSAGKTSLVDYLARRTGHRLVRINNHEHTDIDEYLGSYGTDPATGRLTFIEGALVKAVRHGHWIVLDELNLAPSDVLEALNRLLDDNRELVVPETHERIRAHPRFALFATQNPAGGSYGGRKVLSRAFRNRFVEVHVDDMPVDELVVLLVRRGRLAPSHCRRMVNVMVDLQRQRQRSRVFAGKSGAITSRDLFRWAGRRPATTGEIAAHGFMLLGERLRNDDDREAVRACLQRHLNVDDAALQMDAWYDRVVGDLVRRGGAMFEWVDGPLVVAMRRGDMILIDEISLAEDAVVERLNSVLERGRSILLAEKSGDEERVVAHPAFRVVATMNPGGDFGKKELSPALRNRFTEVWIPNRLSDQDLLAIVSSGVRRDDLRAYAAPLVAFVNGFDVHARERASLRDLRAFVHFMESVADRVPLPLAFVNAALLTVIDGIGIASGDAPDRARQRRQHALRVALDVLPDDERRLVERDVDFHDCSVHSHAPLVSDGARFGLSPFFVDVGPDPAAPTRYDFEATSARRNVTRVLRALQLRKAVLLEGSPGVGKTSLVVALGQRSGHRVTRLNLSEQTDMMDLLGSDLPMADAPAGTFTWVNGPFLDALVHGHWVLLDELNLASQSVLEGLNSVLDHRAEIFIPELDRTFTCHPSFRVFACQNPVQEGGGRKALPASFLNRFTKVYLEEMSQGDYTRILNGCDPRLIEFNERAHVAICLERRFATSGAPWEFNLRDLLRSVSLSPTCPSQVVDLVYLQRLRNARDRSALRRIFDDVFADGPVAVVHEHVNALAITKGSDVLDVPHAYRAPLLHMLRCVRERLPVIVVGPGGSGKTSIVRLASRIASRPLVEIAVSAALDATELLGAFEQVDAARHRQNLIVTLRQAMIHASASGSVTSDLLDLWNVVERLPIAQGWNKGQADVVRSLAGRLGVDVSRIGQCEEGGAQGRFEWVDGPLTVAVENGAWVLLDNANLCAPSVLDRLNALLEPGGTLLINESGRARTILPHPDFRMFFTVDEQHGSLSRAVRNRCVEIALCSPDVDVRPERAWRHRFTDDDLLHMIYDAGVTHDHVAVLVLGTHQTLADRNPAVTIRHLLHWCELAVQQVVRGVSSSIALALALEQTYGHLVDLTTLDIPERVRSALHRQGPAWPGLHLRHHRQRLTALHTFLTSCREPNAAAVWTPRSPTAPSDDVPVALQVALEFATRDEVQPLCESCPSLANLVAVVSRTPLWAAIWNEWATLDVFTPLRPEHDVTQLVPASFVTLGERLACLVGHLRRIGAKVEISALSPLQQRSSSSSRHAALPILQPVLHAIDEVVMKSLTSSDSANWRAMSSISARAFDLRLRLASGRVDDELVWACAHVRVKDFQRDLPASFDEVHRLIDRFLYAVSPTKPASMALWKRSPHPMLPSSARTAAVRAAAHALDRRSGPLMDVSSRRALVEAMATIVSFGNDADVVERVEAAVAHLSTLDWAPPAPVRESFTIRISGADHDDGEFVDEVIETSFALPESAMVAACGPLGAACFKRCMVALLSSAESGALADAAIAERALRVGLQYGSITSCASMEPLQSLVWSNAITPALAHRLTRTGLAAIVSCGPAPTAAIFDLVKAASQAPLHHRQAQIALMERVIQAQWQCGSRRVADARSTPATQRLLTSTLRAFGIKSVADVQNAVDERVLSVMQALLPPLLSAIDSAAGLFLVGAIRLHLMAPSRTVDPMLKHSVRASDAERQLVDLRHEIDVRRAQTRLLIGSELDDPIVQRLVLTERALLDTLERESGQVACRPADASFRLLYDAVQAFIDSHASFRRILSLIQDDDRDAMQLWIENARAFVQSLDASFMLAFEDIASPVVVEVLRMMSALHDHIRASPVADPCQVALRASLALTCVDDDVRHLSQPSLLEHLARCHVAIPAMKLALCRLSRRALLSPVTLALVRLWSAHERAERVRAERQADLYRHRPETGGLAANGDDDDERRLRAMFPTFDSDFADLVDRPVDVDADDDDRVGEASLARDGAFADADLLELYQLYTKALGAPALPAAPLDDNDVARIAHHNALQVYSAVATFTDDTDAGGACVGTNAVLRYCLDELRGRDQSKKVDLFRYAVSSQLPELEVALRALLYRVRDVLALDECRGHPSLLHIARVCARVASLPVSAPLMRLVAGVEQVLAAVEKWEAYAAKYVSLQAQVAALQSLVARWRQMELEAWPFALDGRERAAYGRALRLWPHLLQLVVHASSTGDDLYDALDEFIQTSTLGEFTLRLHMLRTLAVSPGTRCGVLLANLAGYYDPLHDAVRELVQRERKRVETTLKDLTRLARWDVSNWHALKASSERSHRKLMQSVHAWDQVLDRPVRDLIVTLRTRRARPDTPIVVVADPPAASVPVIEVDAGADAVAERIALLVAPVMEALSSDIVDDVRETGSDIIERAESLRAGGAPVPMKKKALSDTIHLLRSRGVRHHASAARAASPLIDTMALARVLESCQRERERDFFKFVAAVWDLRGRVQTHSPELTPSEAKRTMAMQEHVFAMVVAQRAALARMDDQLRTMTAWLESLVTMSDARFDDQSPCTLLENVDALLEALSAAAPCFESRSSLKDADDVQFAAEGHAACLSMIATLTSVREELAPVAARYQIAPIATMPGLQVAASARAAVEGALKLLPALPFPDAFAGVMGRVAASFATNTIDTTATDVDLSVTDQIKLVVQRVVKLCHKGDHDAAFFNWSQHHHHLLALSSALDVTDLVRSLGSHGQRLYAQADVIASQVQAVLRILAGVRDHLHQYNLACTSLGRSCGAILISLVTNGFCKPPPSETDGEEQDQQTKEEAADGTGMGEGRGDRDVSDQIEDEEQLLGLKQDKFDDDDDQEGDQNHRDPVDRDEAGMEMENEFDGDLHDVNPDERDDDRRESDDDDDGEDDEELDKEMGEPDPKDNVVDERLWDDNVDKEDEGTDRREEKLEDDSKVEGQRPDQVDIGAGRDDQDGGKEQEKSDPAANKQDRPDAADPVVEEEGEFPEHDDDGEDEEDVGNGADNMVEDNHDIDMTIPEDLNLDNVDPDDRNDDDAGSQEHEVDDLSDCESVDAEHVEGDHDADGDVDDDGDAGAGAPDVEQVEDMQYEDQQPDAQGADAEQASSNPDAIAVDLPEREHNANACDQGRPDNGADNEDAAGQADPQANAVGMDGDGRVCPLESSPESHDDSAARRERQRPATENPLRSASAACDHWDKRMRQVLEQEAQHEAWDDNTNRSPRELADNGPVEHVGADQQADGDAMAPASGHDEASAPVDVSEEVANEPKDEDAMDLDDDANPKRDGADDKTESLKTSIAGTRRRRTEKHEQVAQDDDGKRPDDDLDMDDVFATSSSAVSSFVTGLERSPDKSDDCDTAVMEVEVGNGAADVVDDALWQSLQVATNEVSSSLTEQLRLILTPQIAAKLGGAFRTGKRLNMRRVIAYIASSFRKDRIWMRRSRLSRRRYDIAVAIDNSLSMKEHNANRVALEALTVLCTSLSRLECGGDLTVFKFGDDVTLVADRFGAGSGPEIVRQFAFSDRQTRFGALLEGALDRLDAHREDQFGTNQLLFIISDALIQQDREHLRRQLRRASQNGQLVVLIVIDACEDDESKSILRLKSVSYPNGRLQVDDYLDGFPFPFYIILKRTADLPLVVADALRQWFELTAARSR